MVEVGGFEHKVLSLDHKMEKSKEWVQWGERQRCVV